MASPHYKFQLPVEAAGFSCRIIDLITNVSRTAPRKSSPDGLLVGYFGMSGLPHATRSRATASGANSPVQATQPQSGLTIEELAERLAANLATRVPTGARSHALTATEAAEHVAAAKQQLALAERLQQELDDSAKFAPVKFPEPRPVPDSTLPVAYNQLPPPVGVRCVFPIVPDSMEQPLDFSSLHPFQVVSAVGGDLPYHFVAYGAVQYHLARLDSPLELLSAAETATPGARQAAHLCRQVIKNCREIVAQRMDIALMRASGDLPMLQYVQQAMEDDLDGGIQLQSATLRAHVRAFKKKKNTEALKQNAKTPKS